MERKKKIIKKKPAIRASNVKPRPASKGRLRAFQLGSGLPSLPKMMEELQDMIDVLMGREDPPLDAGYLTLMETADAYFARASELTIKILEAEREGTVAKGTAYYKFRTGELRYFLDMCKRAADLGSRRLTDETLRFDKSKYGRESLGDDF